MKITVDTDSKDDIRKAIRLLKSMLDGEIPEGEEVNGSVMSGMFDDSKTDEEPKEKTRIMEY